MTHGLVPTPPLTLQGRSLPLLGAARIYVCGVTPYDVTHLGHAATFVWVDALTRVLRHTGVETTVVRNVTDVDDVLTEAARGSGFASDTFAAMQHYAFDHDMSTLRVRRPDHEPRAHAYIPHVITLAKTLVDAGVAYEGHGSVYFRGADVASRLGLPEATALRLSEEFGERADDAGKQDRLDAVMWRASHGDEPAWPSPWGQGRPGWHSECAAMALALLGPSLDIHAGGAELAFPHHAMESAQAQAATGVQPFARAWLRVGNVLLGGQRMAKSAGNLVLVPDLLVENSAAQIRLMLLDRPWSQSWDYSPDELNRAGARLDDLYQAAAKPGTEVEGWDVEHEIVRLLLDDLDVSKAVDHAVAVGGRAARALVQVLALD
jgi:cysteinyl-tRNA synthetase